MAILVIIVLFSGPILDYYIFLGSLKTKLVTIKI